MNRRIEFPSEMFGEMPDQSFLSTGDELTERFEDIKDLAVREERIKARIHEVQEHIANVQAEYERLVSKKVATVDGQKHMTQVVEKLMFELKSLQETLSRLEEIRKTTQDDLSIFMGPPVELPPDSPAG